MAAIASLAVKITADAQGFERGVRGTEQRLGRFSREASAGAAGALDGLQVKAEAAKKAASLLSRSVGFEPAQIAQIQMAGDAIHLTKQGVTGLVGSLGLLKGALAATGIGLLIIGVGALISKFVKAQQEAEALVAKLKAIQAAEAALRMRDILADLPPDSERRAFFEYIERTAELRRAQVEAGRLTAPGRFSAGMLGAGIIRDLPAVPRTPAISGGAPAFDPLEGRRRELQTMERQIALQRESVGLSQEEARLRQLEAAGLDVGNARLEIQMRDLETMEHALRREAATAGMTADQIVRYDLAQRGAGIGALTFIQGLQETRAAAVAAAAGLAEMVTRAESLIEQTTTPLERLQSTLEEIDILGELGLLTWEQWERAASMAADQFERAAGAQERMAEAPAALSAGSQAAFSAIAQARRSMGGGGEDRLARLQRIAEQEAERDQVARRDIAEIARSARAGFVGRVE